MTIEIYRESILIYDFYVINCTVTLAMCLLRLRFCLNIIDNETLNLRHQKQIQ